MMNRTILEDIAEERGLPLLFADGFDDAIIGLASYRGSNQVVYSTEKCLDILANDMSYDEAIEFFSYNVEGAYLGDHTPIFIETRSE